MKAFIWHFSIYMSWLHPRQTHIMMNSVYSLQRFMVRVNAHVHTQQLTQYSENSNNSQSFILSQKLLIMEREQEWRG